MKKILSSHWKPGKGLIAFVLACVTTAILTATSPDIGVTYDEPVYIKAAESYARWMYILVKDPLRAINPETIRTYWSIQNQHPPVEKTWTGLVWLAARHVFNGLTANRLGAILLTGLLVAFVYLLMDETYGKAAGLFASAALLCMPRFFFHAHLAALDVPVAVASFALIFLFWKTLDRKSWVWSLLWGVVWGLATAVKVNGAFMLIVLIAWCMIFRRKRPMVLRLFLMSMMALLTFFAVWPWLYYHTWARVLGYINFNLQHPELGQWYFGHYYFPPPWHFVFVMIWAVVPLTVTLLYLIGMSRAGNGNRDGGLAWLLIMSALVSISPFIFTANYHHDNERLFMPVFPFLAALAGIGFGWLVAGLKKFLDRVRQSSLIVPASLIMGLVLLLPQIVTMIRLYPHLLSYYSEGVGGVTGAAKMGLETTYWGETFISAIPFINMHAKPGDAIWIEDKAIPLLYQKLGLLRQDVWFMSKYPRSTPGEKGYGLFGNADWYILQYYQSIYGPAEEAGYLPLQILSQQAPVFEVSYQGIPLMKIYGVLR